MKQLISILLMSLLISSTAFGHDEKLTNNKSDQTLIEYAKFMRDESEAHRTYLETLYTTTGTLAGILITIFGGIIVWLNWKTKEEFKNQINASLQKYADPLIKGRIKQFENQISLIQQKFEKDMENRHKVLNERGEMFQEELNKLKEQLTSNVYGLVDLLEKDEVGAKKTAGVDRNIKQNRILWVDDIPNNNLVPKRMLENVGAIVECILSTEEAIVEVRRSNYDLILSDMGRGPNSSAGIDLLERLKKNGIDIPVIIYSSVYSIEKFGEKAKELGALKLITGVSPLIDAVHEILKIEPLKLNK